MNTKIADQDLGASLAEQVGVAAAERRPLAITAGNSKAFMGHPVDADTLDISGHSGVISYQPDELVVTVRAGTTVAELQQLLIEHNQHLPFDPPHYDGRATIGGTIGCNASGPSRPYLGAARDFVLGVTLINGLGQTCRFGGEVMKNVAGYDVSRLMAGAMGTLGVLLDISLKVLPKPGFEQTRILKMPDAASALQWLGQQSGALPLTAACYTNQALYLRLSGSKAGVSQAAQYSGGESSASDSFWEQLREQQLGFFNDPRPLWRLSVAAMTGTDTDIPGDILYDWGGAQRWFLSDASAADIRTWAGRHGGHASCLRNRPTDVSVHQSLAPGLQTLHRSLQQSFDPHHILNPGRLYPESEHKQP